MKIKKLILPILILLGFLTIAQEPIIISNETEINTAFQEYSPAFYKNGLVFIASNPSVSTDKKEDDNTGKATTSLFFASRLANGNLSKTNVFAEELTTKFYDGPLSFSMDGNTIYFTRTNLRRGKPVKAKDDLVKLKIYSATKIDNKWSNIYELPFNNAEYDCAHPSVSHDGRRLYFSSNRPDGFGGMDLYVSTLINGVWSDPVNLGPKVNTEKNEIFPFIHADGKVYFASNGHKGIGNLDIFCTMKTDTGWLTPRNLPEPINSRSDDFGLIVKPDKTTGFFSSNRASGKGDDDIFNFTAPDGVDYNILQVKENEVVETIQNPIVDAPVKETATVEETQKENVQPLYTSTDNKIAISIAENSPVVIQSEKTTQQPIAIMEVPKTETVVINAKSISTKEQDVPKTDSEPIFDETPVINNKNKVETPSNEPLKKLSEPKKESLKTEFDQTELKAVVKNDVEKTELKTAEDTKTPIQTVEKNEKNPVVVAETVKAEEKVVPIQTVEKKGEKPAVVAEIVKVEQKETNQPLVTTVSTDNTVISASINNLESETNKNKILLSTDIKVENLIANVDSVSTSTINYSEKKRYKYLVVVGTYSRQENALMQKKVALKKGFQDVEIIHYADNHLYGVCVKQCADGKEAQALVHTINKERNMEAFVKILK